MPWRQGTHLTWYSTKELHSRFNMSRALLHKIIISPVVSYERETWFLTMGKYTKEGFDNKVVGRRCEKRSETKQPGKKVKLAL
jgi:hypothetical protein